MNYKIIPLSRGLETIVDENMFEELSKHKWHIHDSRGKLYAYGYIRHLRRHVKMHRMIINAPSDKDVDHINGDTLDNRKSNLRLCNQSQNQANRKMNKNNKSGYRGVHWDEQGRRWKAQIKVNGKKIGLGLFYDKNEAALAYNIAAKESFGEFASLNAVGIIV